MKEDKQTCQCVSHNLIVVQVEIIQLTAAVKLVAIQIKKFIKFKRFFKFKQKFTFQSAKKKKKNLI